MKKVMRHIHTFESFLGESEIDPDSSFTGLINTAMGPKQGRVVVSGDRVERHKEKILDAIKKVDKGSRAEFYPATQKIVGIMTVLFIKDLQRELRRIDGALVAEIKTPLQKR